MEYIGLIVLMYWGVKYILDVLCICIEWYAHYRDDKQAIAKVNAWEEHKDEYPTFDEFLEYYNKRGK